MTGLRERKKEQTRRRIVDAATALFTRRGFEAVTVAEIAEAAEVAKVTLFEYFPSKESLALDGVGSEDLAGIVAARRPGQSPLTALREYYRDFATKGVAELDVTALVARMRVIFTSPALSAAAGNLLYRQRTALAQVLTEEYGEQPASVAAAQIAAAILTVQEGFFHLLDSGTSVPEAAGLLRERVELAFDQLADGIEPAKGR